ncbi:zinc finger protein 417-like [Ambystoma mexicanum]|uniref:zinc finger protein 417-like n=1 Tax=Ambystoma mexicanum TaxID=8296 RepID=UPI0037E8E55F
MSWQDSDKAPVTFQDVAACFSEEEWKLLYQWQKELYRNVMLEIHQALTSLGPLIAASVFSLRAKEKGDLSPATSQDSERRYSFNHSTHGTTANPNVLCRINREETLPLKNSQGTEGIARSDCFITEEESCASWTDHHDLEEGVSNNHPASGHGVIPSVVSLNIKEEEIYLIEDDEFEKRENSSESTGEGLFTGRRNDVGSLKSTEPMTLCKDSSGKIKENALQTEMEINSRIRLWSDNNQETDRNETSHYTRDICTIKHSNLYQETSDIELDASNVDESYSNPDKFITSQPTTLQNWRTPAFEECEVRFSATGNVCKAQRTHMSERQSMYPDYKKRFTSNHHQNEHSRTHAGERNPAVGSFVCTECAKTFSIKGSLLRHQKAHAGVRYACTECDKSFTQKGDLTIHQRTHSGKNPYTCTHCQKSFSSKCNLNQHKRKHTGQNAEYYPNMA